MMQWSAVDIIRAMWYNAAMDTTIEIERVSVTQLKRETADLLNRVCYGGARIIITSSGKERAALVSVSDLERLLALPQDKPATVDNDGEVSTRGKWRRVPGAVY